MVRKIPNFDEHAHYATSDTNNTHDFSQRHEHS